MAEVIQPQKLDTAVPSQAAMEVVGQCPGDKRKIDQIASTPPASSAGDITGGELAAVQEGGGLFSESDVQTQPICATAEHEMQLTASFTCSSSHEALRKQLMEQNERTRKARLLTERSTPY